MFCFIKPPRLLPLSQTIIKYGIRHLILWLLLKSLLENFH